jgi:opacity protein-like surface antigen
LFYGRVGLAFTELKLSTNVLLAGNTSLGVHGPFNFSAPTSSNKNLAALRLGAGFEKQLCPLWNMRLDYIYTYYGKASIDAIAAATQTIVGLGGPNYTLTNTVINNTEVKVYNNTVMLGLSYLIK